MGRPKVVIWLRPVWAGTLGNLRIDFAAGFLLFYSSNTLRTFGVAVLAGGMLTNKQPKSFILNKTKGSFPFYCSHTQFVLEDACTAELAL
jgi:hypothetical protein